MIIYYYQFWNFYKKTTKVLNSNLVVFVSLLKVSKQWTDAYTHDWRGYNETRQKKLVQIRYT